MKDDILKEMDIKMANFMLQHGLSDWETLEWLPDKNWQCLIKRKKRVSYYQKLTKEKYQQFKSEKNGKGKIHDALKKDYDHWCHNNRMKDYEEDGVEILCFDDMDPYIEYKFILKVQEEER